MKLIINIIYMVLLFSIVVTATETKRLNKSFKVEPNQRIEFQSISGSEIRVKTWDKNEVYVDILVKVQSSDKDFEKEYIEELDVIERRSDSDLIIEFVETGSEGGWSFWDIFKLKFNYYFSKDVKGEIYVPKSNSLEADFRYSKIQLEDMTGEFTLSGRANDLVLINCSNVREIDNNYGDIKLTNCGGELDLESRSSEIEIRSFEGPVKIFANYSNVTLADISQSVILKSRSAKHDIDNVNGDLTVNSDYSEMKISNVKGFVEIQDRSEDVEIRNVGGLKADGPYTNFTIENITGTTGKEIVIDNKSGRISIKNAVGNLVINDTYSNMDLSGIQGNIKLTSRSSTIDGNNLSGDWWSDTKYCKIRLRNVTVKNLKIENRSEPVNVDFLNIPSLVDIACEYGDVTISMPKGFSGEVNLLSRHGKINSDIPLRYDTDGSLVKATEKVGSGSGSIKIETRSSDIEIRERSK